ncbi:MAG: hypothetical protein SFZ03_08510 [Candidatus Melainabacteria bacterium]|nr:hypothetical protein [Candidatus Melainabacteria bacterium]
MGEREICYICQDDILTQAGPILYECPSCGLWELRWCDEEVSQKLQEPVNRAKLRNYLWKHRAEAQQRGKAIKIDNDLLDSILATPLPSYPDYLNQTILYIGNNTYIGQTNNEKNEGARTFDPNDYYRTVGLVDIDAAEKFLNKLREDDYIENWVCNDHTNMRPEEQEIDFSYRLLFGTAPSLFPYDHLTIRLTSKGWQHYADIQQRYTGKHAFMAMQFSDPNNWGLNAFYEALQTRLEAETGFQLRPVNASDKIQPGSIPERMQLQIKVSRFLIADLTYGNRGAYWEAGFAKGLGKKVIYTCHEKCFKDIHFDVKSELAVKWTEETQAKAIQEICNLVQNTFTDDLSPIQKEKVLQHLNTPTPNPQNSPLA